MGLLSLIGAKQRVQFIQAATPGNPQKPIITIDCTISERHSRSSPPSEFPIENGDTVTEHQVIKPFELDIEAIISDTPIGSLTQLGVEAITTAVSAALPPAGIIGAAAGYSLYSALASSKSPSVAAYGQLLQLQASRQPFDVLTSLSRYPSMWIKHLTVPREASTGKVLLFHVSLVQLLLVSPQTVNIQKYARPSSSAPKADAGNAQLNQYLNATKQGMAAGLSSLGVVSQ